MGAVLPFARPEQQPTPQRAVSEDFDWKSALRLRDENLATEIPSARLLSLPGFSVQVREPQALRGPSTEVIPTEALYPWSEGTPATPLKNALRNLKEALRLMDDALEAMSQGDMIIADDAVMHFRRVLPELFCSRSIGDGYGMVINALIIGLHNKTDFPLEPEQARGIRACVKNLLDRPFLSASAAIHQVDRLAGLGLDVDLPDLDFLADISS